MKIVCDSCGAKYSIADEKVAGKVFKIRCKKCSAVIVVKGDQPEEGDESTRVFDYGAEAVWHVVIDGEQQGPYAPRQIADLLAESRIDWEAYVWREGMDGWSPAKDVEALVSAVMAEAEGGTEQAQPAAAYGTGQVFGGSSDMGADPFAAQDDGGLSGVMGQASSKSAAAAGGGADLFAQAAQSPFSGSASGDPGMSNGQSPRVSEDQALTGQRNENSVLFSLSNLQALATGSSSAPASNRPKAGMAQGEGSGLIDIRALASATKTVSETKSNGAAKDSVEDLLSVGSASAFSAATIAAPVAGDRSEGGSTKAIVYAMAAGMTVLLGLVAFLLLRQPDAAPIAQAPDSNAPAPAAGAAQAAAAPGAQAPEQNSAQANPGGADQRQAAAQAEEEGEDDSSDEEKRSGKTRTKRGSGASRASGGDTTGAAAAAAEPAPKPSSSSGDRSLDDLLDSALGGASKKPAASAAATAKPAAAASTLPSMPGKDDVLSAMKSVTPGVSACGNGQSGVAMTKITVSGATGRVTNVSVSGQFAGTPVAACVVKQVSRTERTITVDWDPDYLV